VRLAALGIDDLEHGFFVATDFVTGKKPDECPGQAVGQKALETVDPNSDAVRSLIADLVKHRVALTSTLTVFETFVPGRPLPPGLDVLDPQLRAQFERRHAATAANASSTFGSLFAKARAMELAFARAGGLLLAGTDPTGGGGVIPGYSNQRELELLVESGFTPLEAIQHRHIERRDISRARRSRGVDRRRKRRGPRGGRRESRDAHRRCAKRPDRVQAGDRVRPREADRIGEGQGRSFLVVAVQSSSR